MAGAGTAGEFAGKTAIVTGVGQGIGRAIAADLVKEGAFVIGITQSDNSFKTFNEEFAFAKDRVKCKFIVFTVDLDIVLVYIYRLHINVKRCYERNLLCNLNEKICI